MEIMVEGCATCMFHHFPSNNAGSTLQMLLAWHRLDGSEVCRWEDGMPYRTILSSVDRWTVQNSDTITVSVSGLIVRIKQQVCPRSYAELDPM